MLNLGFSREGDGTPPQYSCTGLEARGPRRAWGWDQSVGRAGSCPAHQSPWIQQRCPSLLTIGLLWGGPACASLYFIQVNIIICSFFCKWKVGLRETEWFAQNKWSGGIQTQGGAPSLARALQESLGCLETLHLRAGCLSWWPNAPVAELTLVYVSVGSENRPVLASLFTEREKPWSP